jgi:hypothetical protein
MDFFTILESYDLLVCTLCKYACLVKELPNHLMKQHKQISLVRRQAIIKWADGHPQLFQKQKDLEHFSVPSLPVPPIPELEGPFSDGLKCSSCPYIVRQVRSIQEHCRTTHAWVNTQAKGGNHIARAKQAKTVPWQTGIPCQRFFKSRTASGWFQIILSTHQPNPPVEQAIDVDLHLAFIDSTLHGHQAAQDRVYPVASTARTTEISPWLRYVGWAEHFQGFTSDFLVRAASLSVVDGWVPHIAQTGPTQLQHLWDSIDRVVRAAAACCTVEEVGSAILFQVAQKTFGQKPRVPFNNMIQPRTLDRYTNTWKRVVGYVFKTKDMSDESAPPYVPEEKQYALLDALSEHLSNIPQSGT